MLPNLPPRPIVYLAGPYRDEDSMVMEARMVAHQRAACLLASHGLSVIAPIAQWAPMARFYLPGDMHQSQAFWMEQDLPVLVNCDALILLPLYGWTESSGTGAELSIAQARHIPILVFEPTVNIQCVGVGDHRRWPKLKLSPSTYYLEA